jgi:hypothetical protein
MVFVQSRIAMLDIFALTLGLFATASFLHGYRRERPHFWFALVGLFSGLSIACKWSGLFVLAVCIVIVAAIRLMQGWRTQFADGNEDDWYRPDLWPTFKAWHFAACFLLIPSLAYLSTFVPLYGLSVPDILEAQRRIFSDNTTTAIAGHTYMSSWPSWPFLIRPVWYLFDKIGDDRIAAVVFLGNPLILWPALIAVAISLRDWIVTRRADAFLVLAFYLGPISPGRCCRERSASSITICRRRPRRAWYWSMRSAAVRRRAGRYGPLLRSVLRASPSCCRSRPRSSARR